MKCLLIEQNTNSCKDVYEEECKFDLDKVWCENCAEIYEGESQAIIDELTECGYDVWDIFECHFIYDAYDHVRQWLVEVDGRKTKQPDLVILK